MKKIFYNSSLPRAGSTLLQNIFAQNPDFYCTPTSGTLELVYGARANYSNDPTFKAQDKDLMEKGFRSFCKNGLNGFYDAITDKPIVLEKSRGWGIHAGLLEFIFEEKPKVVCMVRDIKQIVSSMELKFRNNPQLDSGMVNHAQLKGTTTPKRVDHFLQTQPLGLAIERLNEIFRQGISNDILFVRYEDLCRTPDKVVNNVYNYFGVEPYKHHNFNYIEQATQEDDSVYGVIGDHKIRPTIQLTDNDPVKILGKDVCSWLDNNFKWYNEIFRY